MGYIQSKADYSLFSKIGTRGRTIVVVHVDDIIIAEDDLNSINSLKYMMNERFKLKDLARLRYILGIELATSKDGIFLSQKKYLLNILHETGHMGVKPCETPMEQHIKLDNEKGDILKDLNHYRKVIEKLLYLTITRPNIVHTIHILSQFMSQPRVPHKEAINRLLKYLKGTARYGVMMSSEGPIHLKAYCDSDWASCPMTRRSTCGYCTMIGNSPITWKTKKQTIVSRSSAEAEYRSMALTTCELIWLKALLKDLGIVHKEPMTLFCDNQAAMHIAANPVFHERTKHIKIDCHVVRNGDIQTQFVSTTKQVADMFTKPLGREALQNLRSKLALGNPGVST
ncbi:uncharacterized mitochondrial protein AtMg00810-like [Nymphaea colorata]|uniref:uncharacterized mitochondrial protein AtMg00810-like n=1 Tax=Nymphaea colorata TaxID=210225 RepID=UPI00129E6164|nr:uncharacterized mitochondrial protein AtMg00810-like [Nymphaea colorata]